jgi:shikimate kinase
MIGSKEWKNYDHLPHRATRGCFAGSFVKPWPRIQGWSMVKAQQTTPEDAIVAALGRRAIVLVGMMGAGKSSIGRRLAQRLGIPFVDADTEIEIAAGMSIPDIFAEHGEADFRAGEARVIARLLDGGTRVLATGGGAFMNAETRAAIAAKGISIWLNAEFDVLMKRIKRRHDRPLLKTEDPQSTLRALIDVRYPVYALADLTVQSREIPHDKIVDEIVDVLAGHFGLAPATAEGHS